MHAEAAGAVIDGLALGAFVRVRAVAAAGPGTESDCHVTWLYTYNMAILVQLVQLILVLCLADFSHPATLIYSRARAAVLTLRLWSDTLTVDGRAVRAAVDGQNAVTAG